MQIARYSKAIAAIIGGLGTLGAVWGLNIEMPPEQVAAVSGGIAAVLVYFAPKNGE